MFPAARMAAYCVCHLQSIDIGHDPSLARFRKPSVDVASDSLARFRGGHNTGSGRIALATVNRTSITLGATEAAAPAMGAKMRPIYLRVPPHYLTISFAVCAAVVLEYASKLTDPAAATVLRAGAQLRLPARSASGPHTSLPSIAFRKRTMTRAARHAALVGGCSSCS